MRLLSRYVLQHFVRFLLAGLVLCMALFLLVELFDRMDEFIERQVLLVDAVRYLLNKLPGIMYYMVPAAYLLASVLTFSTLGRYQEITAMRAAGVSPLAISWPLYGVGLLGCVLLLLAQEYLVPYTNQTYNAIWRTRIRLQKVDEDLGLFQREQVWYRHDERIWSIQTSVPLQQRFLGVSIYVLDTHGVIRQRYDAAEARQDADTWVLQHGSVQTFDAAGLFAGPPETFTERRESFPERLEEISAVRKAPEEQSISDTLHEAQQLRQQGVPYARPLTDFHGKFAFAAACVLMAGFGLPLATRSQRRGGVALALSLTLIWGFTYWIVHSLAMAFGYNERLPPVVAAWLANGLFGLGSLYTALRQR